MANNTYHQNFLLKLCLNKDKGILRDCLFSLNVFHVSYVLTKIYCSQTMDEIQYKYVPTEGQSIYDVTI